MEDEEEAGNEVEVIEDSSEVPNQSERSIQESPEEENSEQAQSEAISSGTDGEFCFIFLFLFIYFFTLI